MFGSYRLILACLVALSHFGLVFAGFNPGQWAVVSFYVLSGFLMKNQFHKLSMSGECRVFYADRFLRIYPLFVSVLFLSALVAHPSFAVFAINGSLLPLNYLAVETPFGNLVAGIKWLLNLTNRSGVIVLLTVIIIAGTSGDVGAAEGSAKNAASGAIDGNEAVNEADHDAVQNQEYARERALLTEHMLKRGLNISSRLRGRNEELNYGVAAQWRIVAAACLDTDYDLEKLRKLYPEISRSGGVLGIEDFDRSGTRQILCRGPENIPYLRLTIVRPRYLLSNPSKVDDVNQNFYDFEASAPVTLHRLSGRTYIDLVMKFREYRQKPIPHENFRFFRRILELKFSRHKFITVNDIRKEISRSDWAREP